MNADNQQERLNAEWIVGFTDGEGCFHVSINKLNGMKLGYQVLPEFRIVQHEKDENVLHQIKDYFGFGNVVINRIDEHGIRKEFRVRGIDNLNKIINFFEQHQLRTKSKLKNLNLFREIIELIKKQEHLKREGLEKIAQIISLMNRQPKRKHLESSETIRSMQI
jgi:hypothetical protein